MNKHLLSRIRAPDPSSQAASDLQLKTAWPPGLATLFVLYFMVNKIDSNVIMHWCDVQGQEITIKVTDGK